MGLPSQNLKTDAEAANDLAIFEQRKAEALSEIELEVLAQKAIQAAESEHQKTALRTKSPS